MPIDFSKKNKLVIIMRGVPGAGKSTCSQALSDYLLHEVGKLPRDIKICSADAFMVNQSNQYFFQIDRLREVHGACQRKFKDALRSNTQVIIVDNTNIQKRDMSFYLKEASRAGYHALQWQISSSFESVHDVPSETIERMRCRYQPMDIDNFVPPEAFNEFFHQRIEAKMEEDSLAIESIHVKR